MLTNPRAERVRSVRALSRRSARRRSDTFLAEGPQCVREALAWAPAEVTAVYVDEAVAGRHTALVDLASRAGAPVHECSAEVFAELADSQHPQGVLAVCRPVDVPLEQSLDALAGRGAAGDSAGFVVVLFNVRDPGNAGTVLRAADAAGARAVVLTDSSVELYNPKLVRSTAGSLWHLPVTVDAPFEQVSAACRERGVRLLAADGAGECLVTEADLGASHAWVMGNEAWGLPPEIRAECDDVVRVPIHGHAESLNLAMAATLCVYASAAAQTTARSSSRTTALKHR